jgi:hypothetical protein
MPDANIPPPPPFYFLGAEKSVALQILTIVFENTKHKIGIKLKVRM